MLYQLNRGSAIREQFDADSAGLLKIFDLTHEEIEAIKAEAKRLCSKNPDGSFICKAQDRAIELREWSKRHGPYLNDT
ncbi:MAG: hypothetical protein VXV97_13170, partial [Pseudomonadota bacterium]|nr:hypothetical protein [Pseudomonadota bacterium]